MDNKTLSRIRSIEVEGLFGLYNHRVDLHLEERVTILHGPNGVGKTVLLGMIKALLEGRFSYFGKFPFRRLAVEFSDGGRVDVGRESGKRGKVRLELLHGEKRHEIEIPQEYTIFQPNLISKERPHSRHSSYKNIFIYGMAINGTTIRGGNDIEPSWFTEFRGQVNVHLIETQRLLRVPSTDPDRDNYGEEFTSTVTAYSQDLQQRIKETMASYGRQSQTLDQTFPQRLLTAAETPLPASSLKERMHALDLQRNQLKEIGLLDETPAHPFDIGTLDHLDPTQQRVMTLYVQDTAQKLAALEDLAQRIRLLLENVNRKFRHKRVRIDRDKGLLAEGGDGKPLSLDSLSSGEQHELVLLYDLLFRVQPNTLVLIDEPELSLHVAWQKRFLPDLLEIVKTTGFDVLVATHSPFIVGDRADLMVALDAENDA